MIFDLKVPIHVGIDPIRRHSVDENGDCKIQRLELYLATRVLITSPECRGQNFPNVYLAREDKLYVADFAGIEMDDDGGSRRLSIPTIFLELLSNRLRGSFNEEISEKPVCWLFPAFEDIVVKGSH